MVNDLHTLQLIDHHSFSQQNALSLHSAASVKIETAAKPDRVQVGTLCVEITKKYGVG